MELVHAVGRPRDGLVVVTFEKANCTQVVETTFKKLGLLDAAKAYHPFVHKYRWDVYVRNAPPVTVRDLRTAKREGCHVLKFVRDPDRSLRINLLEVQETRLPLLPGRIVD